MEVDAKDDPLCVHRGKGSVTLERWKEGGKEEEQCERRKEMKKEGRERGKFAGPLGLTQASLEML